MFVGYKLASMNWIFEPWPWYVSGVMIALVMLLLLLMEKNFGMSSNLRTLCTLCGADKKADFFRFDWKSQRWNLAVVVGAVLGGYFASHFMLESTAIDLNPATIDELKTLGFNDAATAYLPAKLFGTANLSDPRTLLMLISGGLLVGFGTRYAGGCTSGHAISGLSNLQLPSLIAVLGFFIGGLLMTHLLLPILF